MSRAKLKPIRTKKVKVSRGYGTFRAGWIAKEPESFNWSTIFDHKKLLIGFVLLLTLLVADQALRTPGSGLGSGSPLDPNTILWQSTNPNNDGSEFNLNGFAYRSSCRGSTNCIQSFDAGKPQWTTLVGYGQCSPCAGQTSSSIGVATNDFLIATFTVTANGGPSGCTITPTDTLTLTWTSQQCISIIATTATQAIWTAKALGTSGSDAVTFTGVNAGASVQVLLTSFTGEQSIGVLANENNGGVAVNGAFSTTISITPTTAGWAVFEILSDEDCSFNGTFTYSNGQTEVHNLGGGGVCGDTTEVSGTAVTAQSFKINANHVNSRKYNHAGLIFYGLGTSHPAISVTKGQVGDLSTASGKVLGLNFTWANPTWGTKTSFGLFLTTNSSTSVGAGWNPSTDISVLYLLNVSCTSACNTVNSIYRGELSFLKSLGAQESIQSEMAGASPNNCGGASSCFIATPGGMVLNGAPAGAFNYATQVLNFTGGNFGETCSFTNFITMSGGACNYSAIGLNPAGAPIINSRVFLPWFSTNTPVYLGFYELTPGTGQAQFGFLNLDAFLFRAPSGATSPNLDASGFFGPIIKALVNIVVFMFNELLLFVAFVAPAIGTAIGFLEGIIVTVLNLVGNAADWGNLGTDLQDLFAQIITYFTGGSWVAVLAQIAFIFSAFFNLVTGVVGFVNVMVALAGTLLTALINVVGFVATVASKVFLLVQTSLVLMLGLFFIVYAGDDGLTGAYAWFQTAQWLTFSLLNFFLYILNFGLNALTFLISIIPKPVIQANADRVPTVPYANISVSPTWPDFSFEAAAKGDYFSYIMMALGAFLVAWYETSTFPGSIQALVPSVSAQTTLSNTIITNMFPIIAILIGVSIIFVLPASLGVGLRRIGMETASPQMTGFTVSRGRRLQTRPGKVSIEKRVPGKIREFATRRAEKARGLQTPKKNPGGIRGLARFTVEADTG